MPGDAVTAVAEQGDVALFNCKEWFAAVAEQGKVVAISELEHGRAAPSKPKCIKSK